MAAALVGTSAWAGTITVTSPNSGDFLGKSNSVGFNIVNAVVQVKVTVTATQVADPTVVITTSKDFTPGGDGKVTGSISLNLSSGLAGGAYNIQVTASEPGAVYNTPPVIPVTVDVKDPEFLHFNPINNSFVRGSVTIFASFLEDFMEEWRVTVAGADIPNNTGNTNSLAVLWNTNFELEDGQKTINISAKDQAGNTKNQSFTVTLDRVAPTTTIQSPTGSETILPGTRLAVVVDITDQFTGAIDQRTVEVTIEDLSGNFIGRVARRSTRNNGNTFTWSGRIRDVGDLPSAFEIVVNAMDLAGNSATEQRVRVSRSRETSAEPEILSGSASVQSFVGRGLTKGAICRAKWGSGKSRKTNFGRGNTQ